MNVLKDLIKAAEDNENILEGQHQDIAFMLEDLDGERTDDFLKVLDKLESTVELKNEKMSEHT